MLTNDQRVELLYSPAVFSECERYRYSLMRPVGDRSGTPCLFIMLNPSTADSVSLDPTCTRCFHFARDWGHGQLFVANLFAFRATDPINMRHQAHPVDVAGGGRNDESIQYLAHHVRAKGGVIVCGWGNHGSRQRPLGSRPAPAARSRIALPQIERER